MVEAWARKSSQVMPVSRAAWRVEEEDEERFWTPRSELSWIDQDVCVCVGRMVEESGGKEGKGKGREMEAERFVKCKAGALFLPTSFDTRPSDTLTVLH